MRGEANLKRLQIASFQLHDIPKKGNSEISGCQGFMGRGGDEGRDE